MLFLLVLFLPCFQQSLWFCVVLVELKHKIVWKFSLSIVWESCVIITYGTILLFETNSSLIAISILLFCGCFLFAVDGCCVSVSLFPPCLHQFWINIELFLQEYDAYTVYKHTKMNKKRYIFVFYDYTKSSNLVTH